MRDLFPREYAIEPPDGDKGKEERGAHYTPDRLALAICKSLRDGLKLTPKNILEPGCGGGAFLRAAHATWPEARLSGVDLVPACTGPGVVEQRDLFTVTEHFDLVLGNPDFAIAEQVVRHFRELDRKRLQGPDGLIALLLLADFEGSVGRIPFWKEHPLFARQHIGSSRPSFREDGQTDMRPYAEFVWWGRWLGPNLDTGLPPLDWKAAR